MSMIFEECGYARRVTVLPDPDAVAFVAKVQKAKTRKNKDYFVLRTTIPKEISEKIGAKAGEYLFFRAKKAQWYHMLNWETMDNTWAMLPQEIQTRLTLDGLRSQGVICQQSMSATNPSAFMPQAANTRITQVGESQWK